MATNRQCENGTASSSEMPIHILLLRLLILAFLITLINAWISRHFGNELKYFGIFNAVIGCFGLLFGYMSSSEKEASEKLFHRLLIRSVDTSVLVTLAVLLLIFSSFISSVSVMASGIPGKHTVYLTPEGKKRSNASLSMIEQGTDMVHYIRFTTPFGRPFYLEVQGYQRKNFDLFPWRGVTMRLPHDLNPAPSIIFRIPESKLMLTSGGKMEIEINDQENIECPTGRPEGSVMVGPQTGISSRVLDEWRSELKAMGRSEQQMEQVLRKWKNPVICGENLQLNPGSDITARFISPNGTLKAETSTNIRKDPFQDIVLSIKE